MEQLLRETLARDEEDLIAFTTALVAIPTENPPGVAYRACSDLITQKLAEIGLEYTLLEIPAPASSSHSSDPGYCILSSYGAGEKTLYFHGHYDVVPASDPAQFQPRITGGKLFGRGSSDMKSGLVAMMGAIQALKACGITLQGKIGLTIVPDEETGGQPEENLAEEKQHLLELFDRLKQQGIDLEVEIFQEAPSSGVSETHPVAQILAHTIKQVTGKAPAFEMCPGLLEIRWYAQQGIPAFAYGPGLLTVSHGPQEFVPVEKITEVALIYALTAVQLLGKD